MHILLHATIGLTMLMISVFLTSILLQKGTLWGWMVFFSGAALYLLSLAHYKQEDGTYEEFEE